MLNQDKKNIETVRNIILNKLIHKANTEDNILRSIYKQTNLSRSESKKLINKYTNIYWYYEKIDNGIGIYTCKLFLDMEEI